MNPIPPNPPFKDSCCSTIGKTTLATKLAQDLAASFQRVYWRSLRDAPLASEWLSEAIGFLSGQQLVPPETEANGLELLLRLLGERPSLLILDNLETLLEPGQAEGSYRDGYASYGTLLQALASARHQGCVILTSREVPADLAVRRGAHLVRTFELWGLNVGDARALLVGKELVGDEQDWADLVGLFGGNGLALKLVGESIRQVFGGEIRAFLSQAGSTSVYGGIKRLLSEQIDRSSALEQHALALLAVEREPMSIGHVLDGLGLHAGRAAVLESLEALRRRSLVERAETDVGTGLTLQSVVLEHVTDRLVGQVASEIMCGRPDLLMQRPLIKAMAKDYVRQSQERLIGQAINQRLMYASGATGPEPLLLDLLENWRRDEPEEQGYGPGNIVNLLRLLRGDVRGLDLSGLSIRQGYLQNVEAQDVSLAGAELSETLLGGAFDAVTSVALDAAGTRVAAGTLLGDVCVWRTSDRTALVGLHGHTGVVSHVAFSADGQTLASASLDGTVRLWSFDRLRMSGVDSGGLLAAIEAHTGGVQGVALSADGRIVVSGGHDAAVRVWDAENGRCLATLEGHSGTVWATAVSGDGRVAASGASTGPCAYGPSTGSG